MIEAIYCCKLKTTTKLINRQLVRMKILGILNRLLLVFLKPYNIASYTLFIFRYSWQVQYYLLSEQHLSNTYNKKHFCPQMESLDTYVYAECDVTIESCGVVDGTHHALNTANQCNQHFVIWRWMKSTPLQKIVELTSWIMKE